MRSKFFVKICCLKRILYGFYGFFANFIAFCFILKVFFLLIFASKSNLLLILQVKFIFLFIDIVFKAIKTLEKDKCILFKVHEKNHSHSLDITQIMPFKRNKRLFITESLAEWY